MAPSCLRPLRAIHTNKAMMTTMGSKSKGMPKSDVPLGLVPVTTTLWLRRSEERVTSLSAVRTWEVYVPPPTILPLTAPADEIVAVEILPAWTSPTKAL
jgi:hypothetical protein